MSRVAELAAAAFEAFWRTFGQGYLTVIAPLAEWSLPDGYRYLPAEDVVADAAGQPVSDTAAYWRSVPVKAVAARLIDRGVATGMGGMTATGNTAYVVPWAAKSRIDTAWGVQDAAGTLWRVSRVQADLPGAPLTVELERA